MADARSEGPEGAQWDAGDAPTPPSLGSEGGEKVLLSRQRN